MISIIIFKYLIDLLKIQNIILIIKITYLKAASGSYKQCCQLLLENGSRVNIKETLPVAVKYGYSEIVEMLLTRVLSVAGDFRDVLNCCLLDSIKFERYNITEIFLRYKAGDINYTDNYRNNNK